MNQSVTINFAPDQIITWIIVGLIAGSLAGVLIRGRGFGYVTSVVVGLLGALVGGFYLASYTSRFQPHLAAELPWRGRICS